MSPLYRTAVPVLLFFVFTACSLPWPGRNRTLAQLPNLSSYRQHEGADLADNLASNDIYFVYYAASQQQVCAAFDQAIPDGE
jgi:hypothetical protein